MKKIILIVSIIMIMLVAVPLKKINAITSLMGVKLVENGIEIVDYDEDDNFVLFDNINNIKPGKKYPYELAVKNSENTNEFVRIIIKKNIEGSVKNISANLLKIGFDGGNNWIINTNESSEDSVTMYCKKVVKAGETTENAINYFMLDNEIWKLINEETISEVNGYKTINLNYQLNGAIVSLDVVVEAVQANDAANAMESAWGITATLNSDGTEIISIK